NHHAPRSGAFARTSAQSGSNATPRRRIGIRQLQKLRNRRESNGELTDCVKGSGALLLIARQSILVPGSAVLWSSPGRPLRCVGGPASAPPRWSATRFRANNVRPVHLPERANRNQTPPRRTRKIAGS